MSEQHQDHEGAPEQDAPTHEGNGTGEVPQADEPGLSPPASPGARSARSRAEGETDEAAAPEAAQGDPPEGGADDDEERGWSPSQMELSDALTQEPIAPRVYYSIGEVCDLTGLKPHVLRYWESQFEVMNPTKNRAGNRVYRPKDIDLVFLVRRLLYEEKYTIEGARKRLLEMRHEGALDDEKQEVLGPEFLSEMKRELLGLQQILTPPDHDA